MNDNLRLFLQLNHEKIALPRAAEQHREADAIESALKRFAEEQEQANARDRR